MQPDARIDLPIEPDAENALLGAIICNGDIVDRVSDRLRADHFAYPAHAAIYQAALDIVGNGAKPDLVNLRARLDGNPDVDAAGGFGYLLRLSNTVATALGAEDYAPIIIEAWRRRIGITLCQEAVAALARGDNDVSAVLAGLQRGLDDTEAGSEASDPMRPLGHWYEGALRLAEEAHKNKGKIPGTTTGLHRLDALIGGLQRGDLVVLGGRPGMGKSSAAVSMARAAARAGAKVGVWTLEMPGEQIAGRYASLDTGIPFAAIRAGRIGDDDWRRLIEAGRAAAGLSLWLDATPAIRVGTLVARARRLQRRHGLDVAVIDYLQLMRADTNRRDGNKVQEVAEITAALKAAAKQLGIAILLLSQLSRGVESRDEKRPMLSDLRDSGSIEQDADVVMFLYRAEYYLAKEGEPERKAGETDMKFNDRLADHAKRLSDSRGLGEIIVAKQRNGPADTVRVRFDAQLMEYTDLDGGRD